MQAIGSRRKHSRNDQILDIWRQEPDAQGVPDAGRLVDWRDIRHFGGANRLRRREMLKALFHRLHGRAVMLRAAQG